MCRSCARCRGGGRCASACRRRRSASRCACSACQPDRAGADGILLPQRAGARVDSQRRGRPWWGRGARRGALARQRERQRACTQRERGRGRRRDANAPPAPAWRIGLGDRWHRAQDRASGSRARARRAPSIASPRARLAAGAAHPRAPRARRPDARSGRARRRAWHAAARAGHGSRSDSDRGQRLARPAEAEQGVGAVLESVEALVLAATREGIDAGR